MICPNCQHDNNQSNKFCPSCGHLLSETTHVEASTDFQFVDYSAANKRKNRIGYIVGVLGFCTIVPLYAWYVKHVYQTAFQQITTVQQHRYRNNNTEIIAESINKMCPILIDEYTKLDGVLALPNNELRYKYTLVKNVVDSTNADSFKNIMIPILKNNVKTSPDLKQLRDLNTLFSYVYYDKNGIFVAQVDITPDMYQ